LAPSQIINVTLDAAGQQWIQNFAGGSLEIVSCHVEEGIRALERAHRKTN
jgi:hypothetical protein